MRISLVTPLYKSAPALRELHRRAVASMQAVSPDYEIIFVNDGSPDDSLAIAREIAAEDPRVTVIDLSRNFGQHPAIMTGLRACTGDYVFICDSDLEDQPEWILTFHETLQAEACDVVYGVQTQKRRGVLYRAGRRAFYWLLNVLSGAEFPANVVTARLMTRRYVDALLQYRERALFASGVWHMVGFDQVASPVVKTSQSATTYGFLRLLGLFVNGITAFSVRPLQVISVAGVALSVIALALICYLLYQKLVIGNVLNGWTSVIATTMLVGGVTLFFNGVMAIYLSKIFVEVKRRPLTVVREIINAPAARVARVDDYRAIVSHYERCLKEHGAGPRAVDWKDEASALARYDVMLGLLPDGRAPLTLLDFGCGLGDLKSRLDALGMDHVQYEGLDISPEYIEAARRNHPDCRFHCLDILEESGALPQFDYVVMNGVFTRRETLSHAQMLAYLERLGGAAFRHARRGLAFNVMSMNADWKLDALFHPGFDEVARIVGRSMSRHMVLRDDYGLYECTCYVRREPEAVGVMRGRL